MGLVINKGAKIKGTLTSGTGDPLLTRDATTSDLGTVPNIGTLTNGKIFIGNVSNLPTEQTVSGDITLSNTGVVAITTGVIINTDVNASAAIALSKLAVTTASRALVSDGSGFISPSATTSTEVGYVSGVTSAIQSQLDAKSATITGAASTVVTSNLSANVVVIANGSGKIASSTTTPTALGYISTLTSDAQTQLNTKLTTSLGSLSNGDIIYYNGSNWTNFPRGSNGQALYSTGATIQWNTPTINGIPTGGTSGQYLAKNSGTDFDVSWTSLTLSKITDVTASAAEVNLLSGVTTSTAQLNYLNTVTSNVQVQIDGKLSQTLAQNAIFVGNGSNVASGYAAGSNGQVLQIVGGVPTWQTISGTGTVTSVALSGGTTGLTASGSPVTTSGTITLGGVLAVANGGTGVTTGAWLLASGGVLGGANVITGTTSNTLKYVFNSLEVTQSNGAGVWFQNSTSAGAGAQQISPSIVWEGQGWKTASAAASRSVKFATWVTPVQGSSNPSGTWDLYSSINSGAYGNIFSISSTGDITTSSGSFINSASNGDLNLNPTSTGIVSIGNLSSTEVIIQTAALAGMVDASGGYEISIDASGQRATLAGFDNVGGTGASLVFDGSSPGVSNNVFTDYSPSPAGIQYASTGLVTQLHSLGDKEYIDNHISGHSTAGGISIISGPGAGTGGIASFTNSNDAAGEISVATGTTPAASATVMTLTFNTAYNSIPKVILYPLGNPAAPLSGNAQVYAIAPNTTTFIVTSGSTPLSPGTTYTWVYHVLQ